MTDASPSARAETGPLPAGQWEALVRDETEREPVAASFPFPPYENLWIPDPHDPGGYARIRQVIWTGDRFDVLI